MALCNSSRRYPTVLKTLQTAIWLSPWAQAGSNAIRVVASFFEQSKPAIRNPPRPRVVGGGKGLAKAPMVIALLGATPVMAQCVDPQSGLVAWWPGDGHTTDVIGGRISSGVAPAFDHVECEDGMIFDAGADAIVLEHDPGLDIGAEFTVDFWYRASPTNTNVRTLIDKWHHDAGVPVPPVWSGWAVQMGPDGTLGFLIGTGSTFIGVGVPLDVRDNLLHHFAGVYNGQFVRAYHDGALVQTIPWPAGTPPVNNTGQFSIGHWQFGVAGGGGEAREFIGDMDEVRLWSRSLGDCEIQAIVAKGCPASCQLPDGDNDGRSDACDNCPTTPNGGMVYDLSTDWSNSQNPNGVWTYGESPTLGGVVTAFPFFETTSYGTEEWQRTNVGEPVVSHNPTTGPLFCCNGGVRWEAGQTSFHPGSVNERAVVRFTAPDAEEYHLLASFAGADYLSPTMSDVHILVNGLEVFSSQISGAGPASTETYTGTFSLEAGDWIDFVVGWGANNSYIGDTTIVSATIFRNGQADTDGDGIGDHCDPPQELSGDPVGGPMNRFISFLVPLASPPQTTAIRVRLDSLHHPTDPIFPPPDFTAFEGEYRYLNSFGGSVHCVDSQQFGTSYKCARLGCQPEYRDWASEVGGGAIFVTGDTVVPDSAYGVAHLGNTCGDAPAAENCPAASEEIMVGTATWGDVGGGGGGPADGNANVIDIGLVTDNVKDLATAIGERRAWLKNPTVPDVQPVNVIDIGLTTDAVKSLPYPYTIAACP